MAVTGPLAFFGRESECARLDELLQTVRGGESEVMVIRGEAGIGKTALLQYCARQAGDCRLVQIAGVESESELPFAGLHQLCEPLLENVGELPEPQRAVLGVAFGLTSGTAPDPFVLGLAVLGLLAEAAAQQPLVCLVDDAQWLDDASSQVVGFVGRRLRAESVLLLLGVRETVDDRLFPTLPTLTLEGLGVEASQRLLAASIPGQLDDQVRDRIVAETRGNPLALIELPRAMSRVDLAGGFAIPSTVTVPGRIEDQYVRRVKALSDASRLLMLVAAADPTGDGALLRRAARTLGVGPDAAAVPEVEELIDLGPRVRFRHPLVRSAVYRSALASERRAAHGALAAATDPAIDPDHRAWHQAHAAPGPNSDVAAELERCASRAQARGGLAAAAAFLEHSALLTPDTSLRVERRLAAAQANLQAGAFESATALLSRAEFEATDEFHQARVQLMLGRLASASRAGNQAPVQLLEAARRLERLDVVLARQTYLDAWGAALFAGHLANPGGGLREVSRAAKAALRVPDSADPFDDLLDGLATLVTDSRAEATPILRGAVNALLARPLPPESWLQWGVLASSAAVTIWDFDSWLETTRQVAFARDAGAFAMLSITLNGQAMITTWTGDLAGAEALVAEDAAVKQVTGTQIAPYGALLLNAYQGKVAPATALIAATIEDSVARGEGLGVDLAHWTAAILNNSLGRYEEAMAMASPASTETPGLYISTWMLPERIEAAVRCGQREVAAGALEELLDSALPADSDWGLGLGARARAMLSEGRPAESLYREAVDRLSRTRLQTEAARAHLVYGEWLRRERRRAEAREQLRRSYELFSTMGAEAFAERARRELLATGETVRKRTVETRHDLTPQEEHIARLARDGRTNTEIGAELFISTRTVEWHLTNVFIKLGIKSRRDLRDTVRTRSS
ncbi:helix-turn-helix transcriptional regulator [Kribbella sp. CA-247076]|uniref:helix-turn-helix transcriptional regulator n=1 Tax=Kribbella sp. CA-247076 TaxID=3239941 RepID=UPI003D8A6364